MNQADKYFNSFFDHFEFIAHQPYSFKSVDYIKPGYRRYVCGVDTIYYPISNEVVERMAIAGRQDLTDLL